MSDLEEPKSHSKKGEEPAFKKPLTRLVSPLTDITNSLHVLSSPPFLSSTSHLLITFGLLNCISKLLPRTNRENPNPNQLLWQVFPSLLPSLLLCLRSLATRHYIANEENSQEPENKRCSEPAGPLIIDPFSESTKNNLLRTLLPLPNIQDFRPKELFFSLLPSPFSLLLSIRKPISVPCFSNSFKQIKKLPQNKKCNYHLNLPGKNFTLHRFLGELLLLPLLFFMF